VTGRKQGKPIEAENDNFVESLLHRTSDPIAAAIPVSIEKVG
jgi:hypothetical protein